jgi:DNA-binding response OmpR family regulator
MKKVLIVDDDADVHNVIRVALSEAYELNFVSDLSTAQRVLGNSIPDLLVLDEMLPDGSGREFCSDLKNRAASRDLPIIMLTRKAALKDKLEAFDSGADDYLVKPFEPLELSARIRARLKLAEGEDSVALFVGDISIKLAEQKAFISKDGIAEEIDLTPIEFKILYMLGRNEGEVVPREKILTTIWGPKSNVIDRTVDQHISKIRRKISDSAYTVKSAHGKGYYFALGD